ncbi:MAG: hypothetical protein J7J98_03745 [candidate division Zixibacteria bacterium]|nr:hypothetical protein [candidate division Zixibacteria bacterium]
MMFTRYLFVITFAIIFSGSLFGLAEAATIVDFTSHDIHLEFDVPAQEATIIDQGEAAVQAGWNLFYLNANAKISMLKIGDKLVEYRVASSSDTTQFPMEVKADLPPIETDGESLLVFFESDVSGKALFVIEFKAQFADPVENTRFSREKVGNEVNGTILEKGAYLSPSAFYYPMGDETLSHFCLTADIPVAWHSVADGNLVSSDVVGDRRVETWENTYKNDGCMFMAAPYVVRSVDQDGIEVACYFFEADTALMDGYLEATAGYLSMYSEKIGPYPFERFTVAENFFPTGYGMPAWTLLGQQVLRLPFIKATSLGHEVLHNWWGNSVYVDYERGNWCEATTVYGADYQYKLNESEDAAKAYRKNILKEYDSYVNEGNDFPIREFTSRSSAGSRTIGYNKAMMVCHMIEQEIGSGPFRAAGRLVFEKYKGQQISWEEWIAAFEETSGQDLSWVIPQWIDRTGAPSLKIEFIGSTISEDHLHKKIRLALSQEGPDLYHLKIPIHFEGEDGVMDTPVVLDSERTEFEFEVIGISSSVELDPDYHLFRRLYSEEIEPIVSAVLGIEQKRFVTYDTNKPFNAAFQSFSENLAEDSTVVEESIVLDSEVKDFAPVLLNPPDLPDNLAAMLTTTDSSIIINDTEYLRAGHTFVFAGRNWNGFDKYLVVLSENSESLPRLGQLIPHYGKYSYLVFKGARNVGKGQWAVTESPLEIGLIPIRGGH